MDTSQLAAVAGERTVRRSFAFVDLSGFTDFVDAHGAEAALAELQHLRAIVREVTPMFGVRVEKWLGDGCMLVGVDNGPVVGAVVAIQERHRRNGVLPLRAGIATGDVLLLDGDDYVGRSVNLASRLCDAAKADEVLGAVNDLDVPSWVERSAATLVVVKGFADPVEVVALTAGESAFVGDRAPGPLGVIVDSLTRPLRARRDREAS